MKRPATFSNGLAGEPLLTEANGVRPPAEQWFRALEGDVTHSMESGQPHVFNSRSRPMVACWTPDGDADIPMVAGVAAKAWLPVATSPSIFI
jgi:hypothetical protein